MNYPNHFMIDIESTGVEKGKDKILQIAMVEMRFIYPYWYPITDRRFCKTIQYLGSPESEFAKKHMVELYKQCNLTDFESKDQIAEAVRLFLHGVDHEYTVESHGRESTATCKVMPEVYEPKYFMGWNASGFDLPFMFEDKFLTPSFYVPGKDGRDEMRGDVHYRIYEQTGSLQFLCNLTGLNSKTIQQLAMDLNPTSIELPPGKSHDALYDCYRQIIMQNGMIAIARMEVKR